MLLHKSFVLPNPLTVLMYTRWYGLCSIAGALAILTKIPFNSHVPTVDSRCCSDFISHRILSHLPSSAQRNSSWLFIISHRTQLFLYICVIYLALFDASPKNGGEKKSNGDLFFFSRCPIRLSCYEDRPRKKSSSSISDTRNQYFSICLTAVFKVL